MSVFKSVSVALLLCFLGAVGSHAANTGGLASPLNQGEAALSMTMAYGQRTVTDDTRHDEASTRRMLFKGIFGLGNNLDFYGFLGLSDLRYRDRGFKGSLGETIGVGLRYSPVTFKNRTRLVFDMQGEYFASEDDNLDVKQQAYHFNTYMVGSFGAGNVGYFFPYAGIRLSYADYNNEVYKDYENDDFFGLMAGADFFANPNVFFSTEFHLFDENAFYLSAGYRF